MHQMRNATEDDAEEIAQLWHQGWRDGHLGLVPDALVAARSLPSFQKRTGWHLEKIRLAVEGDVIGGMMILGAASIEHFYVAPHARGSSVAGLMMAEVEARLRKNGTETAHLACAIGNDRAARFYQKSGWELVGTETEMLETLGDPFPLEVWRFEKVMGCVSNG